jgi:hypothetical protein
MAALPGLLISGTYLGHPAFRHRLSEHGPGGRWPGHPLAGLKYGMTRDEFLTKVGSLPARGAFYIALHPKIVDGSGGTTRAVAIKNSGEKGIGE